MMVKVKGKRKIVCVIMAGGRGTRFWPLSRNSRPKQLLKIIGDHSMLQMTVDRLRKINFVEDIYIITGPDLEETIKNEIEGVSPDRIIVEPSGKNTAPCIGLAALHIAAKNPDSIMGVFPADHLIIGHQKFSSALRIAMNLTVGKDALVTFGIVPNSPHTGYGYIQFDKRKETVPGKVYMVKTFAEKPNERVAKRFVRSGEFLWNSGIFVWKVSSILSAIELHMPELSQSLLAIHDALGKRYYHSTLLDQWELIKPESIDYGILEKSDNIYMVKSGFQWSDVGSWNSFFELSPKNGMGNVVKGDVIVLDGENNLIHSNGKLTAVIGLDNVVIINTPDATLVVSRDKVEDVKELVNLLEESGREEVL